MPLYVLICAFALVAGFVQGLTGFGAGIILMIVLPFVFSVAESAGIAQAICLAMVAVIAWRNRAQIKPALVVRPAVLYVACSLACIHIAKAVDQALMKLILGVFLIVLAIYFLFVKKGGKAELTLPARIACIALSGVCDGLFGIGGPLMVVYYLAATESTEEYLGTLQAFFTLTSAITISSRAIQGLLTASMLPMIGLGTACVLAGSWASGKLVYRLDARLVRRLTYLVIGLAGAYNAATSAATLLG